MNLVLVFQMKPIWLSPKTKQQQKYSSFVHSFHVDISFFRFREEREKKRCSNDWKCFLLKFSAEKIAISSDPVLMFICRQKKKKHFSHTLARSFWNSCFMASFVSILAYEMYRKILVSSVSNVCVCAFNIKWFHLIDADERWNSRRPKKYYWRNFHRFCPIFNCHFSR